MVQKLVFTNIRELSAKIKMGKISPIELTDTFLERLENLGPRFNSIVTISKERALLQAKKAEINLKRLVYLRDVALTNSKILEEAITDRKEFLLIIELPLE